MVLERVGRVRPFHRVVTLLGGERGRRLVREAAEAELVVAGDGFDALGDAARSGNEVGLKMKKNRVNILQII